MINIWKQLDKISETENSYLLEMAMPRNVAKKKIERLAETTCEHVLKCIVFEDTTNNLNHWIVEVATNCTLCGNMTLKPKNNKFSEKEYRKLLFESNFEDKDNVELMLKFYHQKWKQSYPSFKVTPELIDKVYYSANELIDAVVDMFLQKTCFENDAYEDVIRASLFRYKD